MEAGKHQRCHNGGRRYPPSVEHIPEMERLEKFRNELQAKYVRLYSDYKDLYSQHQKTVMNAKSLERKYLEMDNRTYRTQWRKFYEEEIALQELAETIRGYAEMVRNQRVKIWLAKERLMSK